MISEAGLKAIKFMIQQGTPVEIIERDGDNTCCSIGKEYGIDC